MYEQIERYIDRLMTSKPDMPLWNIESIKRGKQMGWNYIDGCMMSSLIELYKITKNQKYIDFVVKYTDRYVNDDGTIFGYDPYKYSTDDVCESKVLFDLYDYNHNEKYLKAIDLTYLQVKNQPRTKEGNFFHKAIYHDQVWLDGLYMVQPFYTRYQNKYNNKDYSDIVRQYQNVRKLMFDENYKLYYHAYDSSKTLFWANKETGLSANFWLRAMGWYFTSLVDVYEYMSDDKKQEKEIIANIFKEAIDGVLLYQDTESKMFYQVVNKGNKKGNYLESSGSSMIAYSILKGVRLGILDESYRKIGTDIFDGIVRKYMSEKEDGELNLDGICLVAGLGPEDNLRRDGSYEYYISEPVVKNDAKGVAPLIMAYIEIIR